MDHVTCIHVLLLYWVSSGIKNLYEAVWQFTIKPLTFHIQEFLV